MSEPAPEFVVVSFIEFEDGGFQAKPLMFGTKAQCEQTADLIPAVAYSGNRKAKSAWISVRRSGNWTTATPEEGSVHAVTVT